MIQNESIFETSHELAHSIYNFLKKKKEKKIIREREREKETPVEELLLAPMDAWRDA